MTKAPLTPRPNILLVHSDQHRWDSLGCAGHPLVRTSHLDALARDGVRCANAFTPSPICSPSRASLLTSTWPHRHRCLSIPGAETYQPENQRTGISSGMTRRQLGPIDEFRFSRSRGKK